MDLGCPRDEIGVHSQRKGSAEYLFGLSIVLSAVGIFLRAGWSIGNVQDRYIQSGAGSDQVIGRAVSLLPAFTTLPPHFTN